ncbi:MAG: porin [Janthinobacterium lividum]
MKKSYIAVSAGLLGLTSLAHAQSSVTLYGVVDAAVTYVHASGQGNKFSMDSSGLNSAVYGMTGTEDLGGGLSANFTLEGDINPPSGTGGTTGVNNQTTSSAIFGRRSFVSLKSETFGEVRLGRDYTTTYLSNAIYDPFTDLGIGSAAPLQLTYAGVPSVRTSNSVFYLTPDTLGGFFGEAEYAFGNNPIDMTDGTGHDGDFAGVRLGYEGHGANAAVAYSKATFEGGDVREFNAGGTYDFKIIKAYALYQQASVGGPAAATQSTTLLGGIIPIGVNAVRFSAIRFHEHGDSSLDALKFTVGYIYNLSKRTQLYGTYSFLGNHKNATNGLQQDEFLVPSAGGTVNGAQIGISTKF